MKNHQKYTFTDRTHTLQNSKRLSFTSILNSRQQPSVPAQMATSRISTYSAIENKNHLYPTLAEMMQEYEEYPDEDYVLNFADDQYYEECDEMNECYEESFQYGENPLEKWITSQSQVKVTQHHKQNIPFNQKRLNHPSRRQITQHQQETYKIKFGQKNTKPKKLTQISEQFYNSKINVPTSNYPQQQPISNNTSQMISSVASDDFRSSLKMGESSLYRYDGVSNHKNQGRIQNKTLKLNNYFGNAKIIQSQAYRPPQHDQETLKNEGNKNKMLNPKKTKIGNLGTSQQVSKIERDLTSPNKKQHTQPPLLGSKKPEHLLYETAQKQINQYLQIKSKYSKKFIQESDPKEDRSKQKSSVQEDGVGYSFASNIKMENTLGNYNQEMSCQSSEKQIEESVVITKQAKRDLQEKQRLAKLAFIALTQSEQENVYEDNFKNYSQEEASQEYSYSKESINEKDSMLLAEDEDLMPLNSQIQNNDPKQIHIDILPEKYSLSQSNNFHIQQEETPQLPSINSFQKPLQSQDSISEQMITFPQEIICKKQEQNKLPTYQDQEHASSREESSQDKMTVNYNQYYMNSDNSRSYDVNYTNLDYDDSKTNSVSQIPEIESKFQDSQAFLNTSQNRSISDKDFSKNEENSCRIQNIFKGTIQDNFQNQRSSSSVKQSPKGQEESLHISSKKKQVSSFSQQDHPSVQSFKGEMKIEGMSNFQKTQTIRRQSNSETESMTTLQALNLLKMKTDEEYKEECALSSENIEKDLSGMDKNWRQSFSECPSNTKLKRMISMPEKIQKFDEEQVRKEDEKKKGCLKTQIGAIWQEQQVEIQNKGMMKSIQEVIKVVPETTNSDKEMSPEVSISIQEMVIPQQAIREPKYDNQSYLTEVGKQQILKEEEMSMQEEQKQEQQYIDKLPIQASAKQDALQLFVHQQQRTSELPNIQTSNKQAAKNNLEQQPSLYQLTNHQQTDFVESIKVPGASTHKSLNSEHFNSVTIPDMKKEVILVSNQSLTQIKTSINKQCSSQSPSSSKKYLPQQTVSLKQSIQGIQAPKMIPETTQIQIVVATTPQKQKQPSPEKISTSVTNSLLEHIKSTQKPQILSPKIESKPITTSIAKDQYFQFDLDF